MVSGPWRFEIEYRGKKISEQPFAVMTTCATS
jgi:hypothetical protein